MLAANTNTSSRFKSGALLVVISVLVIAYVIFSITSIDAWRAYVRLPSIQRERLKSSSPNQKLNFLQSPVSDIFSSSKPIS